MGSRQENMTLAVNAKDKTRGILSSIKGQIVGIGLAYGAWRLGKEIIGDSTKLAMDYEATLKSMEAVVGATGRDMSKVYKEMQTHLGGLANKAQIAEGFLKGMTTELSINQVSNLTRAVKDASLAMGEDFGVQLPMIIKAIKQLNPAILDNIGVTVRLDQVNKRIRDGYYGVGTAINEATQQNAIFQEIMKQTLKFQGQEDIALTTTKGQLTALKAAWADIQLVLGDVFANFLDLTIPALLGGLAGIQEAFRHINVVVGAGALVMNAFFTMVATLVNDAVTTFTAYGNLVEAVFTGQFQNIPILATQANVAVSKSLGNLESGLETFKTSSDVMYTSLSDSLGSVMEAAIAKHDEVVARLQAGKAADVVSTQTAEDEKKQIVVGSLEYLHQQATEYLDKHKLILQKDVYQEKGARKLILEEFRKAEEAKILAMQASHERMQSSLGSFVGSFGSEMIRLKGDTDQVWKAMKNSFQKLLLDEILLAIAPGSGFIKGFLRSFKFWDVAANDRALIREGRRAAEFIQRGMTDMMQAFTPSVVPSLAGIGMAGAGAPATSGPTINIHIAGSIAADSQDFVQNTLLPSITRAVSKGYGNIKMDDEFETAEGGLSLSSMSGAN